MVIGLLAVALSALAALFPPSGDDWGWGSAEGVERWHNRFAGYNGRYVGDVAVLVLTRTHVLTPLVVGVTIAVVIALVARLGRQDDLCGVLVAAALVVSMPLGEWRQTVAWLSGFTNYMFASLVLLVFLLVLRRDVEESRRLGWLEGAALATFAFAGQLLMENVTIVLAIGSLAWAIVPAVVRRTRPSARSIVWSVAALVGAVTMFSNSAYHAAVDGTSGYQRLGPSDQATGTSGLSAAFSQGLHGVSQYAVASNTVLNAAVAALVIGLFVTARRDAPRQRIGVAAMAAVLLGLGFGAAVLASVEPSHYFGSLTEWAWVSSAAMFVGLLLTAWSLVEDRRRAATVAVLAAGVLLLAAPMALVTPYGPRNFLPGYLLNVVIALILLAELRGRARSEVLPTVGAVLSTVVVVAVLAHYAAIYAAIHQQSDVRLKAVRDAVARGDRSISVWTLPYPEYVHVGDPVPGVWEKRYLAYYGLPKKFHVELMDRYARRDLERPPARAYSD